MDWYILHMNLCDIDKILHYFSFGLMLNVFAYSARIIYPSAYSNEDIKHHITFII